jgi:hypothetical protein
MPSSSTPQITFTGAPLGREVKKSEKDYPFHDSTHFSVYSFLFLTQRCSYFNRQDAEIFIVAAVERVMNRGKRKHDITFVRGEDLHHSLILRWIKSRKNIICVTFTVEEV